MDEELLPDVAPLEEHLSVVEEEQGIRAGLLEEGAELVQLLWGIARLLGGDAGETVLGVMGGEGADQQENREEEHLEVEPGQWDLRVSRWVGGLSGL